MFTFFVIDISVISVSENDKPFGVILLVAAEVRVPSVASILNLLYVEKERRGFCPRLQKKRRQQKSFELVMGLIRSIQSFHKHVV